MGCNTLGNQELEVDVFEMVKSIFFLFTAGLSTPASSSCMLQFLEATGGFGGNAPIFSPLHVSEDFLSLPAPPACLAPVSSRALV